MTKPITPVRTRLSNLPLDVQRAIERASSYICDITSNRLHPNDFRDELIEIATSAQKDTECERKVDEAREQSYLEGFKCGEAAQDGLNAYKSLTKLKDK